MNILQKNKRYRKKSLIRANILFSLLGVILNYPTSHKEPQPPTTSHNEPQRATISHSKLQRATTSHKNHHNKPQPPTTSHSDLQQPPRKLSSISLWTLCFIHDKIIIISCFCGLLFLVFNALLFSFVKFKLNTYHNPCLPSDLTKIKTSSVAFNFNLLTFFHKEIDHSLLCSTDREPVFVFSTVEFAFLNQLNKLKIGIFSHSFSFSFEVTK